MDGAFYKNLAMVVFGVHVAGQTPAQILYQFRNDSPVFRAEPLSKYVSFMVKANGAPMIEDGESFESWANRVFDYLVLEGMVEFEGSETIH